MLLRRIVARVIRISFRRIDVPGVREDLPGVAILPQNDKIVAAHVQSLAGRDVDIARIGAGLPCQAFVDVGRHGFDLEMIPDLRRSFTPF